MFDEGWPERRAEMMERIGAALNRAHSLALDDVDNVRNSDFINWAAACLPLMASRTTATKVLSDWLMQLWYDLPDVQAKVESAIEALTLSVSRYLSEDRADADIDLLERISPDSATSLRVARQVLSERSHAERGQVLAQMRTRDVPQAIVDQLEATGATPDVLVQLSVLNWGPEAIATIARVFPAVVPPGGKTGLAGVGETPAETATSSARDTSP